jgi:hypothetical protein
MLDSLVAPMMKTSETVSISRGAERVPTLLGIHSIHFSLQSSAPGQRFDFDAPRSGSGHGH